ncbi:PREDICTED: geranylgeranyl pyrophosphate synthase-like [Trachymyrmex cornetzi]|uniref:geranylgeranyl pyrophosphate synthase-like n=1 Tax=Trachymyrmex cornetzi TaxID=471704 RepID=UPI00084F6A5D|nr:PREDICTED: geranylgeranyl pyrophosphate synthase-like [Trachymyrmex cornetzi]XP_018378173.1 PREDICTED: geranylgeranyl pyrophosphate synthase-like [Trachymyrmex cornetzi]
MADMKKIIPFYHSLRGNTEEDKILLEPVKYILQCNDIFPYKKIPSIFNYWFKISPDKFQLIDEIMQMVNTASIIFDDIQDEAVMRKGFPVTHSVYGLHNSINAANYLELIACEKLTNLHPMAVKILIEQLMEFYKGQGMDIYWKENFICPTEKDYNIVAIRKSGWLIMMVIKLMKLFSTYEEDVLPLASTLALYHQIYDDYCNYDKNTDENSYCDDLTEGKMSFLIIHALRNNPHDEEIINILKQRSKNIKVKRYCAEVLESYGSFKYARDVLDELEKKIRTDVDRLGGNPLLIKILDYFKNKMLKTRI